eukprot:5655646-Pyramimonas_sp.AAC.1
MFLVGGLLGVSGRNVCGPLEAFGGRFGGLLGPLGLLPGRFGSPLGPLGPPGGLWGPLGASRTRRGGLLKAS